MKAEDIQLATAGGMRFMVVYYVPGSVLINFYTQFYLILRIALGYRYSCY